MYIHIYIYTMHTPYDSFSVYTYTAPPNLWETLESRIVGKVEAPPMLFVFWFYMGREL